MDKEILKEIFLLTLEVIKAFCEMLWKRTKGFFCLIWDRFFGVTDISSPERSEEQVWGDTGEDTWPVSPKGSLARTDNPQPPGEVKEVVRTPSISELPEDYGDNRVVLMVRDTECLFAYWELRKEILDNILSTLGSMAHSAKIVLRVYDVTDVLFNGNNAHTYFDIEVTDGTRSWYIHTGKPNRSFYADIGFITPNGTFRLVARSNPVKTPPSGVSEVIDETWMSIEALYAEISAPDEFGSSASVRKRVHKGWQEILKEGVSSPEAPRVSAISKE
ncbi:MAG: hypothetical protein B6D35_01650 [Candidatus Brocadia sp. UTAMX2]|jgi:hypothetical protein|nr:MAG: hypothetical protein B6D35_01650 [Candidatus Brocadia sp. UTAMX2]